ncbi:Solute carrier family 25 member 40 [Pitangus sulphuratus]|nr:Solute carrier family 25 member 40 [Pitangus sulphuratus]
MAEMSNSTLEKPTIIQQAMASCCGAIITSLLVYRKRINEACCVIFHAGVQNLVSYALWYATYKSLAAEHKDAFVKIIRIEGIKSLWSGLPPTLIMAVPNTIIYFTLYDQLREALKYRLEKDDGYIPVLAGSLSRFSSITVVSPLELIRTRMQHRKLSYKQLYLCVSTKVAADGWFSLWKGWSSTVLRDIPFSAMYWYNYERFKKMMCNKVGAHEPTFLIAFTSGAASGSGLS